MVLVSTSHPLESVNPIVIISPLDNESKSEGSDEKVIVSSVPE